VKTPDDYAQRIEHDGFALVENCLTSVEVESLRTALEAACQDSDNGSLVQARGTVLAVRNLFAIVPAVVELLQHAAVRALVEPVLGTGAFAVRGILFDKTRGANWGLLWHQDLSVAVRVIQLPGPQVRLSQKGGVPHFDAPAAVLQQMLTLRFHLDDASEENGALRVHAGSHRQGRLSADAIEEAKQTGRVVSCSVNSGGIVAMRPLLLHSSARSMHPVRRRVIHLEFAACTLPPPLDWHERRPIRE
jgi:ectoine hydroxylase-related dioxygenase (phytanoyl-CoA dioxygenase family)